MQEKQLSAQAQREASQAGPVGQVIDWSHTTALHGDIGDMDATYGPM